MLTLRCQLITNAKIDSLTDNEILIFNAVLSYKSYREIACKFRIHRNDISEVMKAVYTKLEVWPQRPAKLKCVWELSLVENRMQRNIEKQKALQANS